ncbi:hypothetical protein C8J56DRAFT_1129545 [Mycena floridula]|nr:hypothetical protein C8J56DRAFT_1129545 [Mycena floridula]
MSSSLGDTTSEASASSSRTPIVLLETIFEFEFICIDGGAGSLAGFFCIILFYHDCSWDFDLVTGFTSSINNPRHRPLDNLQIRYPSLGACISGVKDETTKCLRWFAHPSRRSVSRGNQRLKDFRDKQFDSSVKRDWVSELQWDWFGVEFTVFVLVCEFGPIGLVAARRSDVRTWFTWNVFDVDAELAIPAAQYLDYVFLHLALAWPGMQPSISRLGFGCKRLDRPHRSQGQLDSLHLGAIKNTSSARSIGPDSPFHRLSSSSIGRDRIWVENTTQILLEPFRRNMSPFRGGMALDMEMEMVSMDRYDAIRLAGQDPGPPEMSIYHLLGYSKRHFTRYLRLLGTWWTPATMSSGALLLDPPFKENVGATTAISPDFNISYHFPMPCRFPALSDLTIAL